jgi:hypothetical protein
VTCLHEKAGYGIWQKIPGADWNRSAVQYTYDWTLGAIEARRDRCVLENRRHNQQCGSPSFAQPAMISDKLLILWLF